MQLFEALVIAREEVASFLLGSLAGMLEMGDD